MSSFANEKNKSTWRRNLIRDNPHIVDAYFHERVKIFIEIFFGKKGLDYEWHWFRVEYQKRGTAHVHGCLRLKGDPGIEKLSKIVLKGRISQRHLEVLNYIEHDYDDYTTTNDQWAERMELIKYKIFDFFRLLSDEQIEEHKKDIENGKKAHDKIVCFHDWLLTTMHPIPPHDSSSKERSKNTFFNQNLNEDICHPSALDVRTLTNVTDESIRKVNYSN